MRSPPRSQGDGLLFRDPARDATGERRPSPLAPTIAGGRRAFALARRVIVRAHRKKEEAHELCRGRLQQFRYEEDAVGRGQSTCLTPSRYCPDQSGKLKEHILLVQGGTTTFLAPALSMGAIGVITMSGAPKSHLGILSREFQMPCVMTAYLAGQECTLCNRAATTTLISTRSSRRWTERKCSCIARTERSAASCWSI